MSTARAILVLAALLPACVTFHDRAGVPLDASYAERIEEGVSTRRDVLALVGPPTGLFDTNLLATVLRAGETFGRPLTAGRVYDDVLSWQEIDVHARIYFFPILYMYGTSEITTRTLVVFFDEQGVVSDVSWREDIP